VPAVIDQVQPPASRSNLGSTTCWTSRAEQPRGLRQGMK